MRFLSFCTTICLSLAISCALASPLGNFAQHRNTLCKPAINLARETVRIYLTTGKLTPTQQKLPAIFNQKAAVFVTIAKNERRRGCKGTFEPATKCLKDEIIRAAIGAATSDIRYRPIRSNELGKLSFTVSIVGPLKRVKDPQQYPPISYGLLVRGGAGTGVILPGEAKTNSWRVAEARRQAGLKSGQPCEMFVFETVALHETKEPPKPRRRSL